MSTQNRVCSCMVIYYLRYYCLYEQLKACFGPTAHMANAYPTWKRISSEPSQPKCGSRAATGHCLGAGPTHPPESQPAISAEGFRGCLFKPRLPAACDTGSCDSRPLTSRWRCSSPCWASCLWTLEAKAVWLESQASPGIRVQAVLLQLLQNRHGAGEQYTITERTPLSLWGSPPYLLGSPCLPPEERHLSMPGTGEKERN